MRRTRLDKLLSENGLSRKQAGQVIRAGRVRVDGEVVRDAAHALDADTARVTLDGEALSTEKHLHLMLNKPAGCLTATEDGRGAPGVPAEDSRRRRIAGNTTSDRMIPTGTKTAKTMTRRRIGSIGRAGPPTRRRRTST